MDDNDEEDDDDELVPLTAGLLKKMLAQQTKTMTTQMDNMMAQVRFETTTQVEEIRQISESAKDIAEHAASSASAANEAIRALRAEIGKMQVTKRSQEQLNRTDEAKG
eukprot:11853694-Karenia_brevis.AAC.1